MILQKADQYRKSLEFDPVVFDDILEKCIASEGDTLQAVEIAIRQHEERLKEYLLNIF